MQSALFSHISLNSILVPQPTPRSSKWFLALRFAHPDAVDMSLLYVAFYMPLQSNFPCFNNPDRSRVSVVRIATMLRGGRSGVRIRWRQLFSAGSGIHPASYLEGT
jgi:hypothetical protein